jgi:hypothetical protein
MSDPEPLEVVNAMPTGITLISSVSRIPYMGSFIGDL